MEIRKRIVSTPLQFSLPETISRLARTGDVTAWPTLHIMRSFWTGGRRAGGQGRPPRQAEAARSVVGVAHSRSNKKMLQATCSHLSSIYLNTLVRISAHLLLYSKERSDGNSKKREEMTQGPPERLREAYIMLKT
jgi:hypothetical protein